MSAQSVLDSNFMPFHSIFIAKSHGSHDSIADLADRTCSNWPSRGLAQLDGSSAVKQRTPKEAPSTKPPDVGDVKTTKIVH